MKSSSIARRPPGPLVLGLGCERGTPIDEVIALAEKALAQAGADKADIGFVASLDARRGEPAIHAAAEHFAVAARFFDAATLEAEAPRLQNPSAIVFAHTGCHGVAEGAALVGAGSASVLLVAKLTSSHATAAIAGPADHRLAIMPATLAAAS
ncbi:MULTISPECIES: cobalamin biosynthesis protein [Ensifer]|jgi:cobalt-precorrin 5A hydrolase|uniref:Cobalamin biosynthesis protein CobE n=1 Tax=Ensifer canadensis TaxID=555315 RepID=A0AAW4FQ31_9HYPH|nr:MULTISPECIES: cobalamin biosynthesis protein [Ensifer]AHK44641.1 CobE protein [Ensifer adhaerens OV14]MDP9630811.1 cobalt-precorrin 5A hydrolase [Ensifer adhaerens]KQU86167.1 cobalamin biosynthesis protein CobE [Ensifer sp. Root31]KQW58749.1 cobalamin biosynthesis protein CobE [Ensifer sp. Root1252]KQW74453.1 cobalamin biosynthesis protein CobE [Ensifer sp. Root127]